MRKNQKEEISFFEVGRIIQIKISPIIALICFVLLIPLFYNSLVKDKQYCSDSKSLYQSTFKKKVNNKRLKEVDYFNYASITYYDNPLSSVLKEDYIISCSSYSKLPDNTLYIEDVTEGDTLYKYSNSNEFTIIKNGKHYIFDVDPNRKKDGNYKEEISIWDKITKVFE